MISIPSPALGTASPSSLAVCPPCLPLRSSIARSGPFTKVAASRYDCLDCWNLFYGRTVVEADALVFLFAPSIAKSSSSRLEPGKYSSASSSPPRQPMSIYYTRVQARIILLTILSTAVQGRSRCLAHGRQDSIRRAVSPDEVYVTPPLASLIPPIFVANPAIQARRGSTNVLFSFADILHQKKTWVYKFWTMLS